MADELNDETSVPAPKKRTAAQVAKFLKLARDRFKQAEDADHDQRERELADLRFYAGEEWPAEAVKARQAQGGTGGVSGLPPVPARPTFNLYKIREPVHQVLNDERGSDMGIELVPADDFGELVGDQDETEIELREGLVRRIQRDSKAADARTWAFGRSTIAGRGFYGVMTRFMPGKTWDQEVYIHRFYNQASVSIDPSHEQPDGSDSEFGFVGVDMGEGQYKAEHPKVFGKKNDNIGLTSDQFRALGDEMPGWFTSEGETRSYRVVDYWYTERETRTLALLPDGSASWEDELPDGVEPTDTRDVIQKTIQWAKIDGTQILDETDWPGPDMPIIKVLAEELQPYDKERRAEGMVRPAHDSLYGFDAMVSKFVETVGLAPIPPFQLDPLQIVGYEQWYQLANTRTMPYLPYVKWDAQGREYGPPNRTDSSAGNIIQALGAGIQIFSENIQSATGVPDSRVGRNQDSHLKSGTALNALQQASQRGTSNYLDNLKRSIRYEGQIINNLLYPIYGQRPGRLARIMTIEGESQTIRVNAPAQPQQGMPGQSPAPGQPTQGQPAPKAYKLTKDASFNVIVKVTRAFDSRRTEEATTIADLLQANPMFMTWFGDLFFKNQDGPGHQEMAERAKLMLDPKIQAMIEQKAQGQDIPPQVQQQMAQMHQQLQQSQQVLGKMHEEIQTKAADLASRERIAQWEIASKESIADKDRAAKIEDARISAAKQSADLVMEAQEERLALGIQAADKALDHGHEIGMAQMAQAHALAQGQAGAEQDAAASDQGHQQALEQGQAGADQASAASTQGHQQTLEAGQQAADLAPAPAAEQK